MVCSRGIIQNNRLNWVWCRNDVCRRWIGLMWLSLSLQEHQLKQSMPSGRVASVSQSRWSPVLKSLDRPANWRRETQPLFYVYGYIYTTVVNDCYLFNIDLESVIAIDIYTLIYIYGYKLDSNVLTGVFIYEMLFERSVRGFINKRKHDFGVKLLFQRLRGVSDRSWSQPSRSFILLQCRVRMWTVFVITLLTVRL